VTVSDGVLNIDILKATKGDPLLCGVVIQTPVPAPISLAPGAPEDGEQPALALEPRLNLQPAPGGLVLWWPTALGEVVLQQTDSLAEPVRWQDVPGVPAASGLLQGLGVPLDPADGKAAPQRFYRLRPR
jgi:hypothetical protein